MALYLIKNALNKGSSTDYVLADSQFIYEKLSQEVSNLTSKLHVIGLMKINRSTDLVCFVLKIIQLKDDIENFMKNIIFGKALNNKSVV